MFFVFFVFVLVRVVACTVNSACLIINRCETSRFEPMNPAKRPIALPSHTPILANLFLGFHEETCLNNFNHSNHPLLYRRYVDDTFCVFHNEQDAMPFFDYINSRHPNIKFTFEKENENSSFLT